MVPEMTKMHSETREFWRNHRVRLRAVEPEDWEAHWQWNKDSETGRCLERVYLPQTKDAARRWAERESEREPSDDVFHFEIENLKGELVGGIATHTCDHRNGTFSYGLSIKEQHQRRGYASAAIRLVLKYFFQELRYQKATVDVFSFNRASVVLHERLGFQREGRLRRMTFTQGEFFDKIVFGLTAEEFAAGLIDDAAVQVRDLFQD